MHKNVLTFNVVEFRENGRKAKVIQYVYKKCIYLRQTQILRKLSCVCQRRKKYNFNTKNICSVACIILHILFLHKREKNEHLVYLVIWLFGYLVISYINDVTSKKKEDHYVSIQSCALINDSTLLGRWFSWLIRAIDSLIKFSIPVLFCISK